MKKLPLEEAVADLMTIEPHVEAVSLTLAKVTLPDGRDAILRMELTTDEWEVDDAEVWKPNTTAEGRRGAPYPARGVEQEVAP